MSKLLDPNLKREFKELCRLLLKSRNSLTVTLGDLTVTTITSSSFTRGGLLCIRNDDYSTVCDEITGMKFDYHHARRFLPALRAATLLDRLADV